MYSVQSLYFVSFKRGTAIFGNAFEKNRFRFYDGAVESFMASKRLDLAAFAYAAMLRMESA